MSQVPLNSVVDELETSFMDLPNEIIVDIFKYLNIPSRLKMGLNRRLNEIQSSIEKRFDRISMTVGLTWVRRITN